MKQERIGFGDSPRAVSVRSAAWAPHTMAVATSIGVVTIGGT